MSDLRQEQEEALKEMVSESQRLGLYDDPRPNRTNLKAHYRAALMTTAIVVGIAAFIGMVVTFPLFMAGALLFYMVGFAIYFVYMVIYESYKEDNPEE